MSRHVGTPDDAVLWQHAPSTTVPEGCCSKGTQLVGNLVSGRFYLQRVRPRRLQLQLQRVDLRLHPIGDAGITARELFLQRLHASARCLRL